MSTPDIGRECVIYFGDTAIAHGKGATVGQDADLIKEYEFESQDPALLKQGNKSYPFSIELLYIDEDIFEYMNNSGDGAMDIEVYPLGSGETGYTLGDVVITGWELPVDQNDGLVENIEGEGASMTAGAFT